LQIFRIEVYTQVYEVKRTSEHGGNVGEIIFSSSIKCTATVYLKEFNLNDRNSKKEPSFLREYSVQIFDELILKTIPILRVEAVSTNSLIHSPLIYTLLDGQENFLIDSAQGFIYPRQDSSLQPGITQIKVMKIT
jgi:hypothetical protein